MMPAYASKIIPKSAGISCNPTDEVWGDGFSRDTLRELVLVRDWEEISRDEYIRVFPNLLGQRPRELSACIKDAFDDLRTWVPHRPSHGPWRCLDAGDLGSLDIVRRALEGGEPLAYDQDLAERVAFLAAVHPAYVWKEAVISHQLFGGLGWLGIVFRGRPALMPLDIAEFFIEAIVPTPNGGIVMDPSLKKRIWSDRFALNLLSSAQKRRQGEDRVYRLAEHSIVHRRVPLEQVTT